MDGGDNENYLNGIPGKLNQFIQSALESDERDHEDQAEVMEDKARLQGIDFESDILAYQKFGEVIDQDISENTIIIVFDEIANAINELIPLLFRGVGTDLWRFMYFMYTCLEKISIQKFSLFKKIQHTLREFCEELANSEKFRLKDFFEDMLIDKFIEVVRTAKHPKKRKELIMTLFYFYKGSEVSEKTKGQSEKDRKFKDPAEQRKDALVNYKSKLNDMTLFLQSLGILISNELLLKGEEELYLRAVEDRQREQEDKKRIEEERARGDGTKKHRDDDKSRAEENRRRKEEAANDNRFEEKALVVWNTEKARELVDFYMRYAELAIKDKKPGVRLHGLVLMNKLIDLDYPSVQKVMVRYFDCVSSNDWWENRIMIVTVYSSLLKHLTQTELYQKHFKMKNSDMTKMMSAENEMLVKVTREVFNQYTEAISKALASNLRPEIAKVAVSYLVDIMGESRSLVSVFIDLVLEVSQDLREWILYDGQVEEEEIEFEDEVERVEGFDEKNPNFKNKPPVEFVYLYLSSLSSSVSHRSTLDINRLESLSGEVLSEMSNKIRTLEPDGFGENYLEVLVFCFTHTDLQKLNVEVIDSLINYSLDHILNGFASPVLCQKCGQILERYIENFLREEVLIQDLEKKIGEMVATILNHVDEENPEAEEYIKTNLRNFLGQLRASYTPDKALYEKFAKVCIKIYSFANENKINNHEDAAFLREKLGFELEKESHESEHGNED